MPGYAPLKFRVPEPPGRPGDTPDFSGLELPAARSVRRPPVDSRPGDLKDMPTSMVRVLDGDGRAVGEWAADIGDDTLVKGLKDMVRMRVFDDRMLMLQRQGKTSFYMKCTGEEAVAIAQRAAQREGDMNFPTYRQQGLLIAGGYPLREMVCQILSNARDPLRGHQMPILHSARDHGFFTVSGNLATQFIHAVGWAMASAIRGDTNVAAGWIGEGSTAENDFHAAIVAASVYRPPVVLNVVNNQWAISSFRNIAGAGESTFAEHAAGYDIPGLRADGNDFLAVHAVSRWAFERARRGHGPTLVEWVTYRAGPHSTADDPSRYRPREESAAWPLGDPIERLAKHLEARGLWDRERHERHRKGCEDEIRAVAKEAEAHGTMGAGADPRDIFESVYREMPRHLAEQRRQLEE